MDEKTEHSEQTLPQKPINQPSVIRSIYPEPTVGLAAPPPTAQLPPPENFSNSNPLPQLARVIRVVFACLIGFFLAGSFYLDWDGDVLDRAIIAESSYSPTIVFKSILSILLLATVYGLASRFILRSRFAFSQALFAIIATELLVLLCLGIKYLNATTLNIIQTGVTPMTIAAAVGGSVLFGFSMYGANHLWSWRVSRLTLAIFTIALLFLASFGVSTTFARKSSSRQAQQTEISEQARIQKDAGIYNFDADFEQYYLNNTVQQRFSVTSIAGTSAVQSEESKYNTRFLRYSLKDSQYTGENQKLRVTMYQTKISPAYNPPYNCPEPLPPRLTNAERSTVFDGACIKVKDIPNLGTLYARNQYAGHQDVNSSSKGYDWYYIQRGDTLIAIDTVGTVEHQGIELLVSNLVTVSPVDLLQKSKALASGS